MGSILRSLSFNNIDRLGKTSYSLVDREERIGNSEMLSSGISAVIGDINNQFSEDESDSISLYDFIVAYIEEYHSFKEKYDSLGRLDFGEGIGFNFCDYVEDSKNGYRFLSLELLYDNYKAYFTDPVAPSVKINVPGKKNENCRFIIYERDGKVSACFNQNRNNPTSITVDDVPSDVLKQYLDLFGKHRQLFEIARRDDEKQNIRLENGKGLSLDISINVYNFLANGLRNIGIKIAGVVDSLEGEYNGKYSMGISVDSKYSLAFEFHLNGDLVKRFLSKSICSQILKEIIVDRKHLKGYKGKINEQVKNNNIL